MYSIEAMRIQMAYRNGADVKLTTIMSSLASIELRRFSFRMSVESLQLGVRQTLIAIIRRRKQFVQIVILEEEKTSNQLQWSGFIILFLSVIIYFVFMNSTKTK